MTNRSDDDAQSIPRLGETASEFFETTLGPSRTAKEMVHAVMDLLAQSENRDLIQSLTFEMRGDGTYFLSLETKA